ncbi:MAG: hypothetical protein OXF90_01960, partial [Chloroflexi bacterium]|nr:hypothetical protein [Chloroflexota bacterium]
SQCQTFVVTGIGHHRDQTLSDQVADHAAATPTAAAHFLASRCLSAESNFSPEAPDNAQSTKSNKVLRVIVAVVVVIVVTIAALGIILLRASM